MTSILKTLIPLLSSVAFLLLIVSNPARSQTTSFTYDFYGLQPTDLTYQGDAHFPSIGSTYLRLTKTNASGYPQTNSFGRAVYTKPIQFWQPGAQVDFQTTVKFKITTVNNDPADGIVFFIAPVGTTIPAGSVGSHFGVFDPSTDRSPSVFAVEFDTYVNGNWDPNYRHLGIDIEYVKSVATDNTGNAVLDQEVTAVIQYVGALKTIKVGLSSGSNSYELTYNFDLSTVLNQQVQVGLAGASGGSVSIHDVVAWYFTATLVNNNAAAKIRQYV